MPLHYYYCKICILIQGVDITLIKLSYTPLQGCLSAPDIH
jgi:hypothetical protein